MIKYIWTNDEIIFLRENINKMKQIDIARKVNKPRTVVYSMSCKLGLAKPKTWSDEEIKILRETYSDWNAADISSKFIKTRNSGEIDRMAYLLGIKKNDKLRNSKKNKFKIYKEYAEIDINMRCKTYKTKVSLDKLKFVINFGHWFGSGKVGYIYPRCKKNKKVFYLHRLLLNAKSGKDVDHINGDTLDNRMENIREVTMEQNAANITKPTRNKWGVRYLSYDNQKSSWIVRYIRNHKPIKKSFKFFNEAKEYALKIESMKVY